MKRISLITLFLLFNFSFSQKKELRKAQKLFDAGDVSGSLKLLEENQTLFENADEKAKRNYKFLKAKIAKNNEKFQLAYDLFTSLSEELSIKEEVKQQLNLLSTDIVNSAIDDNGTGDYDVNTWPGFVLWRSRPNKKYVVRFDASLCDCRFDVYFMGHRWL